MALARPAGGGEVRREYFCEDIKKPFFTAARTGEGLKTVRNARPLSISAEFSMPKPAKTARVFIVGESAAGLLGGGDSFLNKFLGWSFPGKEIEIINCGMPTYESRRILAVFKEALEYSPDLLIVLSGNNEAVWDFCPGFNAEAGRRVRRLGARLAALAMPREDAEAEVSISLHEDRLRAMAALARKKGVPVLFSTLPVNLRDFAPRGTLPEGLAAGVSLVYGKAPEAALKYFSGAGPGARDPFRLFYAGRALEQLGRKEEALLSYAAAVKYDPASDRCSADRNAMIRRVAAEEGQCLADLEKAFLGIALGGITGGNEIPDGVHWYEAFNPFVSAVIGQAVQTCPSVKAKAGMPAPETLLPAPGGARAEDFRAVFSYASAYARDAAALAGREAAVFERVVVLLETLCRMDCGRLERLLSDEKTAVKELLKSDWNSSLGEDPGAWRPALLRSAAEMFRRTGRAAAAARAQAALPAAEAAGRLVKPGSPARPLREGEAAAKKLSDEAVKEIQAGNFAAARLALEQAVQKDGDSLEIRFNACFLAARQKDPEFGEEHCQDAISLAAYPPKHAEQPPDAVARAFYARACFRFETGNKAACEDLRRALEKASPSWNQAAEAAALAQKRCPG
ncbi:MAG: hypothetical protein A2X35_09940 [Elusimicrobia bacterium GWA2_61_42]|nr:MAG: hypothetical protein A2X35_09940 [Elusimicrobia bacterium GWA2_61_42]OGR74872.1 MAG: hypothetical protein A2X38_08855 [Elusimicrobia bacterium GWC2_61_25]